MTQTNQPKDGHLLPRISGDAKGDYIISKIKEKDVKIGVVGLGQVGLPTALSFAKVGYSTMGYDTNSLLVDELSSGITSISEEGISNLLVAGVSSGKIIFTTSYRPLMNADVIVVCVPTPVREDLTADLSYISKAVTEVASNCMETKKLLIIESSVPPGTMSGVIIPTVERNATKKLETGFLLAYSPERLSPGHALNELSDSVRVIGVADDQSYKAATALYSNLTYGKIIQTSFETAEVSKLAENAFRDVNIAFANELAIVCQDNKVDVTEVIRIANTHQRVNIHNPGPGVGGPCLPKDPYLLISNSTLSTPLIRIARSVNDSMPSYVVDILVKKIEMMYSDRMADKVKVGILGVSYKPNVNDFQNTPTKRIISELTMRGYQEITVHDPICKERFGMRSSFNLKSLLKASDCIIICTGHETYATLSPEDFKPSCIVIDAVRILRKAEFIRSRLIIYAAPGLDI